MNDEKIPIPPTGRYFMDAQDKGRELFMRAQEARKLGRHAEAEGYLREALLHDPTRESIRTNLCGALIDQGKHVEALPLCEALVADFPGSATGWHRLSLCQFALGDLQGARDSIERCLALNPENANALAHRFVTLLQLDEVDEAIATGRRAVALTPDDAALHTGLGVAYTRIRDFASARASHERALELEPMADRQWNLALAQLMLGDFADGWRNMEGRWAGTHAVESHYTGNAPRWDGTSPAGKTILVWAEQGQGDSIQFCRFLPLLVQEGAKLVFQVQPSLRTLMRSLPTDWPGSMTVITEGDVLPPHDCHLPLMSLPGYLGDGTLLPPPAPLAPPGHVTDLWYERLGPRERPRVGLMWQGNLKTPNGLHRNVDLSQLAEVLALPLEFHCVSNVIGKKDTAWLRDHASGMREHLVLLRDFADTAGLLTQLDLLISIDTSIAHLGPSLHVPTWVLLPHAADWRWGTQKHHTAWYPESRLFRQPHRGDWQTPVRALRAALADRFGVASVQNRQA